MSSPGVVVVRITSEFRRVEAEGGCARDSAATVQALEGVEGEEREEIGLLRSVDTWETVFTSTEAGHRDHNKAGNREVVKIQAQSIPQSPTVLFG